MAKLITKHRRGTTEEWLNSTVIPEDGEIIVETCMACKKEKDCIDFTQHPEALTCPNCGYHRPGVAGQQKIKIGNGRSTFSELPYLTSDVRTSIEATNARIDNLLNYWQNNENPNDDTLTLDEEVIDARVGYGGIQYESAGSAIRAVGEELSGLSSSLDQFKNAEAVDGLFYENNMLYLTASGNILTDSAVEIKGGSGTGGGGGTVATSLKVTPIGATNKTVTAKEDVILEFNFESLDGDVPTGNGTVTVTNKGATIYTGEIVQGYNAIPLQRLESSPVINYLSTGTNNIRVTCTDMYGNYRTLAYTITRVELSITSTFDSAATYSKDITFKYTPFGNIEKLIHFELNGYEFATPKITVTGKQTSIVIPKSLFTYQGAHRLKVWATATMDNDENIVSNVLEYDILWVLTNIDASGQEVIVDNTSMIGSVYQRTEIIHGELVNIPYVVFDPTTSVCDIELRVAYDEEGTDLYGSAQKLTVNQTQQVWSTRSYPEGEVYFVIYYKDTSSNKEYRVSHKVFVKESNINVHAHNDSLECYLSAANRSNNEDDPAKWEYTPRIVSTDSNGKEVVTEGTKITTTFENFNWVTNGWIKDADGDTCLRLTGDAKAEINFRPFATDFKGAGKTLEFEFAIRDVNNREATVIDIISEMIDGEKVDQQIGFKATADTAFIRSEKDEVEVRYKDEERIRVGVSVEAVSDQTRFISIYIDGILSGVAQYALEDNFKQPNPVTIRLGSQYCGLDIYTIRIYNTALDTLTMRDNYIADMTNIEKKLEIFDNNNIYIDGLLDYESLKDQIPTVTFVGQMPTYKGDKRYVKMIFEDPNHPDLNFEDEVQIDVQGTSSQFYARKNWKVKLPSNRQHMVDELAAKIFCLKVDYAEATGTHNTQNANFVETLYSEDEKVLAQYDEPKVRTTITGFPIVIFEKETENSKPVFSSKGNFNYDKGAEHVFGFTSDYDVECWEFCNNTTQACLFTGPIPESYDQWKESFEARYPEETTNIARFRKMHEWVVSTMQSGATGASISTYTGVDGKTYTTDTAEYRLAKFKKEFTNYFNMHYSLVYYVYTFFALMTDQRAKNMFLTYWPDRGDNSKGHWYPYFYDNDTSFGINNEGDMAFDYYHEDTDTVNGANVYNGQESTLWVNFRQAFPNEIKECYADLRKEKLTYNNLMHYFVEEGSDKYSESVYNEDAEYKYITMARPQADGSKSDTSNLYQIRGSGEHHFRYFVDNRLKYCDSKWYAGEYPDDEISLRIYTPRVKPLEIAKEVPEEPIPPVKPEGYDEASDADKATLFPEYTAALAEYERLKLEREEIIEFNTNLEQTNANIQASNTIIERTLQAVPANPSITVTPFSNMYAGVRYKANGTLQQRRLNKNESYQFSAIDSTEVFNDTETAVYGARELSSIGDLSALYCGTINVSNAVKLTELIVGNSTEGYVNSNLKELNVGTNPLLKRVNVANCPEFTTDLDLSGCSNIEEIYAKGSHISGVSLPEAGYLRVMELPDSITTLTIKNQLYLTNDNIKIYSNETGELLETYPGISTLWVENCPEIDVIELFEKCPNVTRIRLTDVEWEFETGEEALAFFETLYTKDGISDSGVTQENKPTIKGNCHINNLLGSQMTEIQSHLPDLKITYINLTSYLYCYDDGVINEDGERIYTVVYRAESKNGDNVIPYDQIADFVAPTRASTPEFEYTYNGYSRVQSDTAEPQDDAFLRVEGDRHLYPTFNKTRRSYYINFYNKNYLLYQVLIPYGEKAIWDNYKIEAAQLEPDDQGFDYIYDDPQHDYDPIKQGTASPEAYMFTGFLPDPATEEGIKGAMDCYAQHEINKEGIDSLNWSDLAQDGYTIDEEGNLYITNYNGGKSIIMIPETLSREINGEVETYKIVSVGGFSATDEFDVNVELVSLPNTLTEIADNAFANCQSLTEVEIPESVTTIGNRAFANCVELDTIKYNAINASITATTSEYAPFYGCNSTTGMGANVIIGKNVTKIPPYLFSQNSSTNPSINTLSFEEGTKCSVIGNYAFVRANIREVEFAPSITEIGQRAFSENKYLRELNLPVNLSKIGDRAFEYSEITKIDIPGTTLDIGYGILRNCPYVESITVNSGNPNYTSVDNCLIVKSSGRLIAGCRNSVIPTTVTNSAGQNITVETLDQFAFEGIRDLYEINIPETVKTIGNECFEGCKELTTVNIPDGITTMGHQAFRNCTSLTEIKIPDSLSILNSHTFGLCSNLKTIHWGPSGNLVQMYAGIFNSCTSLEEVELPEGLTNLGDGVFNGCSSLTKVTLPSSLKVISLNNNKIYTTFANCDNLTEIVCNFPSGQVAGAPWGAPATCKITYTDS